MNNQHNGTGKRFNEGKIRIDLLPAEALRDVANVFTMGAAKYGPSNWRSGMSWSNVIASLERHLSAFKRGEDYDPESGFLHISHLVANGLFLGEYYKIYPQGDDRSDMWVKPPRIGLDIDDVLADFCGAYAKRSGLDRPKWWAWTYGMGSDIESKDEWSKFISELPRKISPEELPFEPVCYITSRSVPTSVTENWIERNGFPCVPVITVGHGESKVEAAKKAGIEVFVDDNYDTFMDLNAAGICCYLMSMSHNLRYNVGYRRIGSLKDLPWFKK